jgi:hypothetical protein
MARPVWTPTDAQRRQAETNLSIRMCPRIFGVWDQPINRPALDLVGRPRSLISGSVSRAPRFEPQQFRVPPAPGNRKLIVGQDVSALLRLGPTRSDHDGDLDDAELPSGEHPGWPAIRPPSSPTSAGLVQPHSLMLAAMAAI